MKSKKVVVHLVEAFGGGVAHSTAEAIRGSEHSYKNIVVHGQRDFHMRLRDSLKKEFPNNLEFIEWESCREINLRKDFSSFRSLVKLLRQIKPDLIHCHSSKAGVHGRMAATLLRVPCLYTAHSYSFFRRDISNVSKSIYWLVEFFLARLGTTAACGLDEFVAARRMSGKVMLLENGVNSTLFRPAPTQISTLRPRQFTYIGIGRITAQKDFELFEQFAALDSMKNNRFIWITGEPDSRSSKASNLVLLGTLSPAEVVHQLQSADIFVSTSKWEGLSRAVLEATSVGLPLLLRNCDGNRELIFKGAAGALFQGPDDIEDAAKLVEASVEADENSVREKNRKVVEQNYSNSVFNNKLISIYDALTYEAYKKR